MAIIASVRGEFIRYKDLAEAAIAQLADQDLTFEPTGSGNSIAVICWHISGNLRSRFTDFLTSDGEKPWRKRDEEFERRPVTKAELLERWNGGWSVLLQTLDALSDADLDRTVTIRRQPLAVHEALHRSLAHTASHVGQIVFLAKSVRGGAWTSLSIPLGQSEAFNRNPR